jgi:GTP:adenosylcobinamide-phosphate guanylyltransferase
VTTALVLAGKRDGVLDPLAAAAGVTHKCLTPVQGRPMILHVLEALSATPEINEIIISIDEPEALAALNLERLNARGARMRLAVARPNLVDSVTEAVVGASFPVLITTADNVMLTPSATAEIDEAARRGGADVAVVFARQSDVLAAHPDGQRRFYRFREDTYSNCNAYWLGGPAALRAAEVFRQGGQFAKHPGRIVAAFGLFNLIRFRFGLDTLGGLLGRLSRRFRMKIQAIILADGAVAIDVDNARTLKIATELLDARSAPAARRGAA